MEKALNRREWRAKKTCRQDRERNQAPMEGREEDEQWGSPLCSWVRSENSVPLSGPALAFTVLIEHFQQKNGPACH